MARNQIAKNVIQGLKDNIFSNLNTIKLVGANIDNIEFLSFINFNKIQNLFIWCNKIVSIQALNKLRANWGYKISINISHNPIKYYEVNRIQFIKVKKINFIKKLLQKM